MRSVLLSLLFLLLPWSLGAEDAVLRVAPLPLNAASPQTSKIGALTYLGGLAVESDLAGFGGWSGGWARRNLSVVTLVSDRGNVAVFDLERDGASGAPIGLQLRALHALLDMQGRPLTGRFDRDAESLAWLPGEGFAVGFEHAHRIWLYGNGLEVPPTANIGPEALASLPVAALNSGVEALAQSPDGRTLIAILEGPNTEGRTTAFLWQDGPWRERAFVSSPGFGVTAASYLENGDLLVLERFFSPATGPLVNLVRVTAETLAGEGAIDGETVATFARPMNVDNFEIVMVGREPDGSPLVLIASDDNFNKRQRFLLMLFRFDPRYQ